jgi:hypothetical protein
MYHAGSDLGSSTTKKFSLQARVRQRGHTCALGVRELGM